MAAGGFSDNAAILGDTMNFPESSSVKKKEALSNVIFKITQSTEKVNKRNERLLKINLDYELRMLRLARQKEKIEWEKLNCDKLCSSQTNHWLFEQEDTQGTRNSDCYEGQILPSLSVDQNTSSTARKGRVIGSLRRTNTAPMKLSNRESIKKERESRSMGNIRLVDDDVIGRTNPARTKGQSVIDRDFGGEIDLPKIFNHIRVKWEEEVIKSEIKRDEKMMTSEIGADGISNFKASNNENTKGKLVDVIHHKDTEKGRYKEEEEDKKIDNFTKLLKRAEESTKISSAYIPSGTTYRRLCASRKAYDEAERSKPRILTRYLREKRAFESLSKTQTKTYTRGQTTDKKCRIVLSYI